MLRSEKHLRNTSNLACSIVDDVGVVWPVGVLVALQPAEPDVAAPIAALVECKKEETDAKEEDCQNGRGNAMKGEGMNPLEVSRMLGMLKK